MNNNTGELDEDLLDFVSHILDSHGHNHCDRRCPTIEDNAEELMALIARATKEAYERGRRDTLSWSLSRVIDATNGFKTLEEVKAAHYKELGRQDERGE
jgi:hypothetical protein